MSGPKVTVMLDILEEHFEELQFLWGFRQGAIRSPQYDQRTLQALEDRIEAHTKGLLGCGEFVIPLATSGLAADDPLTVFASAYTLLRLNTDVSAGLVMDAFRQAEPGKLDGFRQALCHGPVDRVEGQLREAVTTGSPPIAVTAAEALAFHSKLDANSGRLSELLRDESPDVRKAAWRIVSILESKGQA